MQKESQKQDKKLFSIGQVAKEYGIHQDTLRNWEREGTIRPLRVGKRRDRRYRPEDIEKIIETRGLPLREDESDSDKMTLAQLKVFLWRSADILRGKIDSSDYKKYIFGLLFYKRISDVWDEEYEEAMKAFHDESIAAADHNHRFQVPKDCRWEVIEKQAENIGGKLNEIFDKLAKANTPKLDRIFDDLDFANRDRFPNEVLQRLINHFSEHNFGTNYISSDLLGDAYEYLIEQFAADAGKKGGEFYTTREVIDTIIKILKPHEKDHIYDMAVGSGGFLLGAYHYLKEKVGEKSARSLYLYGQEINIGTFAIAKINMFLHGLDGADIRRGDTLADPKFLDERGKLQAFDICVANPPYSIKEWEYEAFASNRYNRLEGYGAIPKKNADFAFILHMIKSMNEHGRAGIVLPHGVLFRGGAEGKIREQVIKQDLIETVISLPAKLFYGTGIPVAVLILNKAKPKERQKKILFISAENEYQEGSKQNKLRNKDIERIVETHEQYRDIEKYARVVGFKELEENEFNLNVRRYVDTSQEEEKIDVSREWKELQKLKQDFELADKKVAQYIKQLKY